jgi:hypothetical protein
MEPKELTFLQAAKVWWSQTWRALVLMIPVMIVWTMCVAFVLRGVPKPAPGERPQLPAGYFVLLVVMALVGFMVHIQSLRWALKTRWADFHLAIVPEPPKQS